MFQELDYAPEIRTDLKLFPLVERASDFISSQVGNSANRLKIRWDKHKDEQNHDLIRLTMQDWKGAVYKDLTPDELGSRQDRLHRRLRWLYGDLLMNRSQILLDELMAMDGSGEPNDPN
jgi:hypothetical protein